MSRAETGKALPFEGFVGIVDRIAFVGPGLWVENVCIHIFVVGVVSGGVGDAVEPLGCGTRRHSNLRSGECTEEQPSRECQKSWHKLELRARDKYLIANLMSRTPALGGIGHGFSVGRHRTDGIWNLGAVAWSGRPG